MRVVDQLLTLAGRSGSLATAVKIAIGDVVFYNNDPEGMQTCRNTDTGLEWSTKPGNRISEVKTYEQPYGGSVNQKSYIILNNTDNFLTNMDFKGERCSVCWGAQTIKGRLYDKQTPTYVKSQVSSEQSGSQVVTLTLLGLLDWLGQDTASCDYISNGTDTGYDLAVKILGGTIPPFDGCKPFNIIIDGDYDAIFDTVVFGPSFKITKGKDTRATVLARILDTTYVKMRAGCEELITGMDSVHFFQPTKEVTNTFSLDETDHKYLVNSEYSEIFAPNEIIVKNPNNEGLNYFGKAVDKFSHDAIPSTSTVYISGLASSAQAILVANAILQNLKTYYNSYSARVPMMFGLELYDRPQLTSRRTGKTYTGNVGSIERVYAPRKSEPQYYMQIQSGKWFDPRATWDIMGVDAGFVDTSEENLYTSIFVSCRQYSSRLGDWDVFDANGAAYWSPGMYASTDGSWAKYKVKIPAGSYKLRLGVGSWYVAGGGGILNIYIDDILAATIDTFLIFQKAIEEDITIAVSLSDWHEFKFIIEGKNDESASYYLSFTDFVLCPY